MWLMGHLTSLTSILVVANQYDTVCQNFLLEQKSMVRNQERVAVVFTIKGYVYCFVCKLFATKIPYFVTREGFSDYEIIF